MHGLSFPGTFCRTRKLGTDRKACGKQFRKDSEASVGCGAGRLGTLRGDWCGQLGQHLGGGGHKVKVRVLGLGVGSWHKPPEALDGAEETCRTPTGSQASSPSGVSPRCAHPPAPPAAQLRLLNPGPIS